jgi:hypothetical protein
MDTEASLLTMDQVLSANEINFAMLAIVPALLAAGVSIYIIQGIAMRFLRRKDRSRQWAEMRRHLRWLDIQLIRSMRSPSVTPATAGVAAAAIPSSISLSRYGAPIVPSSPLPSSSSKNAALAAATPSAASLAYQQHMSSMVSTMSDSQLGFFLLRLRRLAALEYALPREQRPLMARDIEHLRSLEFDSRQKNLIIASMYRTYPFLSHDSSSHHLPL